MLLQIIKRAPLESGFRRRVWNINSRARAVSSCAARGIYSEQPAIIMERAAA
jgi:hypothetical protein